MKRFILNKNYYILNKRINLLVSSNISNWNYNLLPSLCIAFCPCGKPHYWFLRFGWLQFDVNLSLYFEELKYCSEKNK